MASRPQSGIRRSTSPLRSTTNPVRSASAASGATATSTWSVPGTSTVGGTETVARTDRWRRTLAVHVPTPPPASSSVTALVVTAPSASRPSERPVGRAVRSGASAAATSTSPAPPRIGSAALSPSSTGRAVVTSADFTCATVQLGWRCRSSAAAPATCGAAMLVPELPSKPPGHRREDARRPAPRRPASGAARAGSARRRRSEASRGTLSSVTAATVIASAALPGDVSEPVAEVVVVVARGHHGHDAGGGGGVERERDDVARRLDLRLAEREVDHVHPVARRPPRSRRRARARCRPGPTPGIGRDRQRLVVPDVGARGDARDTVRPPTPRRGLPAAIPATCVPWPDCAGLERLRASPDVRASARRGRRARRSPSRS